MQLFRIKTLNKIAPEGLTLFKDNFVVNVDEKNPQGILVRSAPVDVDDYPDLLAVARAGAGVNNITVEKATEKGICVFNTPGANANAVAELVFTMLGVRERNIHKGMKFCQELVGLGDEEIARQVEEKKSIFRGIELAGKNLGVLGLGKIGVLVANGGIQRHMNVIGFDPSMALENIHLLMPEVTLARSLEEAISDVDILSLHIPLNEKTNSIVDDDLLRKMKRGTVLVNYARGPIVDEQAVINALRKGHLNGFITDFPTEAILKEDTVLVSPHLGASTEESEEQCSFMAVKELKNYLTYGTISHSVNFPNAEIIPTGNVHTRFIMVNRDVPGMIGFASQTIGEKGINIVSYLNESNGTIGYNIIDLQSAISPEVIAEIEAHPGVIRTRTIRSSNNGDR